MIHYLMFLRSHFYIDTSWSQTWTESHVFEKSQGHLEIKEEKYLSSSSWHEQPCAQLSWSEQPLVRQMELMCFTQSQPSLRPQAGKRRRKTAWTGNGENWGSHRKAASREEGYFCNRTLRLIRNWGNSKYVYYNMYYCT